MSTINFRVVAFILGILTCIMSAIMLIPLMAEMFYFPTKQWQPFAEGAFLSSFLGSLLALAFRPDKKLDLHVREAFLLTTLSWIVMPLAASLPFYFMKPWDGQQAISFTQACFESVSGLTTTGSTVLTNLDKAPGSIWLWRSMLQWMGGIGIIVMAMSILPVLRIGGMQLFRSESSDRSEKILPRLQQIVSEIFKAYLFLTLLCASALMFAGMTGVEALCHAMGTVSTGGLSTRDASIAGFHSLPIELIILVFMIIGGMSLIVVVQGLRTNPMKIFKDPQHQAYLGLIVAVVLILTFWKTLTYHDNFATNLRLVSFSVTSVLTSTGYTTADYSLWGPFAHIVFLILSLVGGCTGSTTGGIKIFRFQVLFSLSLSHLRQLRRPHGVYLARYRGQKISESIAFSVFTFVTLYLGIMGIIALALSACGLDFVTSLSGAASALGNTGPGLGPIIGPASNFSTISPTPLWILMVAMILGRLELLTVFVLIMPSFWRD